MNPLKRERLKAAGYQVGDFAEFLDLSPEETRLVEVKVALTRYLRELRTRDSRTQAQVAALIGSSQSRIAKAEAADDSVSLELIMRSLFALGASPADVGRVIAGAE